MLISLLMSGLALVASVCTVYIAVHTWRHAPGARLWAELGLRIEDLEWENQQRRERRAKQARLENVEKATVARKEKRSVEEEAAAILSSGAQQPKRRMTEDEQLAEARRLAGLLPH